MCTADVLSYGHRPRPGGVEHSHDIDQPQRRTRPAPVAGALDHLPGPGDAPARRDRGQRRAPAHPARSRVLRHQPGVGRQRLHRHLRRAADAGRTDGRPAGPQAHVHDRPGGLRARVGQRRPGPAARCARRQPLRAGRRGRPRQPGRPLPADVAVHPPAGTSAGDGHLERPGRSGRGPRRHALRCPDRSRLLALDLLRQPADRRLRDRRHPPARLGEPGGQARPPRHRRRRADHPRPAVGRVRPAGEGEPPVGLVLRPRLGGDRRRAADRFHAGRGPGRATPGPARFPALAQPDHRQHGARLLLRRVRHPLLLAQPVHAARARTSPRSRPGSPSFRSG